MRRSNPYTDITANTTTRTTARTRSTVWINRYPTTAMPSWATAIRASAGVNPMPVRSRRMKTPSNESTTHQPTPLTTVNAADGRFPSRPNGPRDWTSWSTPVSGPRVENRPTRAELSSVPVTIARTAGSRSRPNTDVDRAPTLSVANCTFAPNQSVKSDQGRPCRRVSGTGSAPRRSMVEVEVEVEVEGRSGSARMVGSSPGQDGSTERGWCGCGGMRLVA